MASKPSTLGHMGKLPPKGSVPAGYRGLYDKKKSSVKLKNKGK